MKRELVLSIDQNDNNKDIDITLISLSKWDMRDIEEVEKIKNFYYLYYLYHSELDRVWDFYINIIKFLKNLTCWTYINNLTIVSIIASYQVSYSRFLYNLLYFYV